MGVARIFSGGGHFFKKISKYSQRIFKKYSNNIPKNFQKIVKRFSKIFKNFLKKIAKMHYFRLVFSQFNQA